jgi:RNA recognition motif-containing protein
MDSLIGAAHSGLAMVQRDSLESRRISRVFRQNPPGEEMKTIYVGNLPFSASEDQIRQLFEQYGKVQSVKLITDRETGRPRGFGFVEMDGGEADAAISALNGQQFGGRSLRINEARERPDRGPPRRRP